MRKTFVFFVFELVFLAAPSWAAQVNPPGFLIMDKATLAQKRKLCRLPVKTLYEGHPDIEISHIFLSLPLNAKPEQVELISRRALSLKKQLETGSISFDVAAAQYSEGVAAPHSGAIGEISYFKVDLLFYQGVLEAAKKGEGLFIVKSSYGFHIVKVGRVVPWNLANRDRFTIERKYFCARSSSLSGDAKP